MWVSGLKIWCCHCSGLGCCCGVGSIPGLWVRSLAWAKKKDYIFYQLKFKKKKKA